MKFDLTSDFSFSSDITSLTEQLKQSIDNIWENSLKKYGEHQPIIKEIDIKRNKLSIHLVSHGLFRPHSILLQMKNVLSKELGTHYNIGIRDITISKYQIEFDLEKKPLKNFTIPFATLHFHQHTVTIIMNDLDEEFLRNNYIDRMIALIKEKVENQYYTGKEEFWKLIWKSGEKQPLWTKNPTEEMHNLGWIIQGPTKGKWFYRPQAATILKTMETIAIREILHPLGFQEIIESHIIPFDIWMKTGHLEGMPGEIYYVSEPLSRDPEKWERFIDITKIKKEVPLEELRQNVATPSTGICYAQCPMIYWSLRGKTISEKSLPILLYDRTAISNRYESGGRHGIERVDEFHRIEPVYIGTKKQLLKLREEILEQYKHVFNDIFNIEWRMAWVTPWYMQQAGKITDHTTQDTGTIDFEAYMPYRGDRKTSKWLEFQNLSILGDKYIKAFNIKAQKSLLWSGCSGIGLERWTTVFLAQKGLDPKQWPTEFRNYLKELPKDIEFL